MAKHRTAALLGALSDGRFHSGEALADALDVSRAAVWKRVQQAREAGYPIDAVSGRGYRWRAPFEALDAERIRGAIAAPGPGAGKDVAIEVHDTVESTSTLLRERGLNGDGPAVAVWAERQTGGRGRVGRPWVSPPGGLYCSIAWPYERLETGPMGFSVLCGTCVALALRGAGIDNVSVKWPNDLQVAGAKLGGILTEIVGDPFGPCRLIVGVGVNWWAPSDVTDQPTVGLAELAGGLGRNELAAAVANGVMDACRRFPDELAGTLERHWPSVDALADAEVTLETATGALEGRMVGVDRDGALLLSVGDGVRRVHSGETRLRRKP